MPCTDCQRSVFDALRNLRMNRDFCDVQVITENISYSAHRVMLAASSDYFRAMLSSGMLEDCQSTVTLNGVSPHVFSMMLDYIYGVDIELDSGNIEDIIVAADMFGIGRLVEVCQLRMIEDLDVGNCIGLYCFANRRSFLKLRKAAWTFVMKNFYLVIKEKEFVHLSFEDLIRFVASEEICIKTEADVLFCIIAWISHDVRARRSRCAPLIAHIRYKLVSEEDIRCLLHPVRDFLLNYGVTLLMRNTPKIQKSKAATPRLSARKSFYMIGGRIMERPSFGSEFDAVQYIDRFDSFSKRWDRYPLLLHNARCCLAAVHVDRKIYAIGGESDSMIYASVECYDSFSRTWNRDSLSMVVPRSSLQAVAYEDLIYLIGGDTGSGAAKSIEIFHTKTNQCQLATFQMQTERHSFGAACHENVLYMAGGVGSSTSVLSTMECYDLHRHDWWSAKDMNTKRSNFSLVKVESTLYAVGGHNEDDGTLKSMERYDTYKNIWIPCAQMGQARAGAFLYVVGSDIFVAGGKCLKRRIWQTLSTAEVYDINKDSWSRLSEMDTQKRCDGAAVVF